MFLAVRLEPISRSIHEEISLAQQDAMEKMIECCAGLDVRNETVAVCVGTGGYWEAEPLPYLRGM